MSRHHPVKVSYRQKGREYARQIVCACGCPWAQHNRGLALKPCERCRCPQFRVSRRQEAAP